MISENIELRYEESKQIKTFVGGILTICMACVAVSAFILFSQELVLKENPLENRFDKVLIDSHVPLAEFPIAFTLTSWLSEDLGSQKLFMDNHKVYAALWVFNSSEAKLEIYYFWPTPCTDEVVDQEFLAKLESLKTDSIQMCFDFKNPTDVFKNPIEVKKEMSINRPYGAYDSAFLDVYIRRCFSSEPNCTQYIEPYGTFWFNLFVKDSFSDSSNFSQPINKRVNIFSNSVDYGIKARQFMKIVSNQIITDSGWIFENNNSDFFFSVSDAKQEVGIYTQSSSILYSYTFESMIMQPVIKRRYLKLQELAANMGGFIKSIALIAKLLANFVSEYHLYSTLAVEVKKEMAISRVSQATIVPKERNQPSHNNLSGVAIRQNEINLQSISFFQFLMSHLWKKYDPKMYLDPKEVFRRIDVMYIVRELIELKKKQNELLVS